jgi:hypothetical protein
MYPVESLHYGFRLHKNIIDSEQRANFSVEQIDVYLNEALNLYIATIVEQVEYNQKRLDDLRPLVVRELQLEIDSTDTVKTTFKLPKDYYRRLRSFSIAENCSTVIAHIPCQLDDLDNYLKDSNYKPSLVWGETIVYLHGNLIDVYHQGDFNPTVTKMDYIKTHPRLANPEKSRAGQYNLPDGTAAVQQGLLLDTTNQPDIIVEIAVLNASMDTSSQEYQLRLNKLFNLNKI